jgi:hypothetical protein
VSLTTDVYQLLYEGLRDGWLCLDDLGPDLAGVQVWLALPGPCPLHDDAAAPCRNVVVREFDAGGAVARYRHCDPDGPQPTGDTEEVVAVRVLWSDGNAEVLGPEHAAYFHRVVARHRHGP